MLDHEKLTSLLKYDPETGVFIRLVDRRSWRAGTIAGCVDNYGYRIITINNKPYKAHRLAWFYMKGYFPEEEIDHINQLKDDNRFCNLREAERAENSQNIHQAASNNKGGIRGVSFRCGRWRVVISIDGKQKEFASCKTKEEAAQKYKELKKKYQPFAFWGANA